MNENNQREALDQLTHVYAASAAIIRGDEFAVDYLRTREVQRHLLIQGALQVTAQAVRFLDGTFERDLLVSLVSDPARCDLLDGAVAHLNGDRLTGYETVERLSRVKRSVTDVAAPLIAELWSLAAFLRGQKAEDFAMQLCLAAGMIGAVLED
jgi:hypothetical protein